jgi:hypothetical protein
MQTEKKNQIENTENRPTATTELSQNPDVVPIHSNCQVCASGIVDIVHKLRPQYTLRELSEVLKNEHNVELSKDALHNHFRRYTKNLELATQRQLYENFEIEVDNVVDHQRKTLFLAGIAFDHILDRLESGTLVFGIDEFEKLVKMYHTVLKNPQDASDNNIVGLFQKMSSKFGCTLEQGVLIRTPKTPE